MSKPDLDRMLGDGLEQATQFQRAGQTDAALEVLNALEQRARPAKHPGLAYVLIQKAGWLRELGRTEEARSALDEAETVCAAMPAKLSPLPSLRMEQGIVARQSGDLAKAESFLTEARKLATGSPAEIVMMSDILANLSSVYSDQGRMEDAQTALLDAIGYDQKTGDPRALASNLNMLGLLYQTAGDLKTARVYLTHSRDIASEAGLVKETADAVHNLATISDAEGQTSEARAGFEKALESAVKAGRRPEMASAKTSLGILAARDGKFEEAGELLGEAQRLHSELGLAEFCVNDLINLSQNDLSLNQPDASLEHGRAALAMAEHHGLLQKLWAAHYCVAQAQASVLRQSPTPDPKGLEAVLESYIQSADAIDLMRAGIGRPEERESLLVDKEMVYEQGMLLAGLMGLGTVAWTFAERARGRAFLDSLGASRVGRQSGKDPLAMRRAELTRSLMELADAGGAEGQALLDELRLVRSRIIADSPAVAAVTEGDMPGIQEVAAVMPPDTAMVEFFFGPGNHITVFVLKQKGVAAMTTLDAGTCDIPGTIQQFCAEVQYEVPEEPTGKLLFLLLFQRVWDAIADVGRLFIVPHRELHYLPWAALWFSNSGDGPKRMYLCQRFQLSVVPSAAYLVHALRMARRTAASDASLVMGNPTNDLPASEDEAAAVGKLLRVEPLLRDQAVRGEVLGPPQRHRVIHIASHGVYDERDPLLSGMLLADGRLTVEDLLDADILTDLLTLSGCLTGIAAGGPGDELVGLSRAALAAGIPSVITTLWEVRDEPTREFFTRFYGHIREGMNKDTALGITQHSMLAEERYAKASNWAPFVLLGDCR